MARDTITGRKLSHYDLPDRLDRVREWAEAWGDREAKSELALRAEVKRDTSRWAQLRAMRRRDRARTRGRWWRAWLEEHDPDCGGCGGSGGYLDDDGVERVCSLCGGSGIAPADDGSVPQRWEL